MGEQDEQIVAMAPKMGYWGIRGGSAGCSFCNKKIIFTYLSLMHT